MDDMLGEVQEDVLQVRVRQGFVVECAVGDRVDVNQFAVVEDDVRGSGDGQVDVIAAGDRQKEGRYEAEEGIVICYGTMYGNTERMAEVIARAASEAGVKNIVLYNVSKTHHSYILRDIFRYKALIVGAPTYNTSLYHEMDVLLSELAHKDMKNRLIGWFGSFGWASKAVAKIKEWNDTALHFEAVGEPVEMKQAINDVTRAQCEALGHAMAERLIAERG